MSYFLHSVENTTWALLLVPVLVEADERMAVDWCRASWCGQGRDESDESPAASPVPGDNHNSAGTRDHILISRYLHMSALLNRITTASPNHPVTTVRATLLPLFPWTLARIGKDVRKKLKKRGNWTRRWPSYYNSARPLVRGHNKIQCLDECSSWMKNVDVYITFNESLSWYLSSSVRLGTMLPHPGVLWARWTQISTVAVGWQIMASRGVGRVLGAGGRHPSCLCVRKRM